MSMANPTAIFATPTLFLGDMKRPNLANLMHNLGLLVSWHTSLRRKFALSNCEDDDDDVNSSISHVFSDLDERDENAKVVIREWKKIKYNNVMMDAN